jgi:predicted YcjX-like family ATPase
VLKGYAGTGKTTVISTIVNNLLSINKNMFLANRSCCQVIANYSENLLLQYIKKSISQEVFRWWRILYFTTKQT